MLRLAVLTSPAQRDELEISEQLLFRKRDIAFTAKAAGTYKIDLTDTERALLGEVLARIDYPGRIVRGVDHDNPGAWRYCTLDRVDVEIK